MQRARTQRKVKEEENLRFSNIITEIRLFDGMKRIKMKPMMMGKKEEERTRDNDKTKRQSEKIEANQYHAQEWKQTMDLFALLRIMLIKCSHLSLLRRFFFFFVHSPFVFLFQFGVVVLVAQSLASMLVCVLYFVCILGTF